MKPLIIGIGNPHRSDDGIGPAVLEHLQPALCAYADVKTCQSDPSGLLDEWKGREHVIIIDSCCHDSVTPGTIFRLDGLRESIPADAVTTSSHAFSLADAIALGRQLNSLPTSLTLYAVVGQDFHFGTALSENVEAAIETLCEQIYSDLNPRESPCTNSPC